MRTPRGLPGRHRRDLVAAQQIARPQPVPDGGFTMAEVIVAFVLFMLLAGTAGVALTHTLQISHANSSRVVAANLAAREMEIVRGLNANDIADGTAATQTVVIDGQNYYLDRTATLDVAGGSGSACSGASGPAAFKRVTVRVSWDRMDGVRPVQSDTLKALTVHGLTNGTGVVSVPVQDATGNGVPGVAVTLGGTTRTTAADGCAVFAGMPPGTAYTAVASATGYVGQGSEATAASGLITVTANEITKVPALLYDRAAELSLNVTAPGGYPVPTGLGVTLGNTMFTGTYKTFSPCAGAAANCAWPDAGRLRVGWLFPSTAGYQAWVGTCSTARVPGAPTLAPGAGSLATGTPPQLGGVAVTVKAGALYRSGYGVIATNAACPAEAFALSGFSGTSDAAALKIALPAGTWKLQARLGAVNAGSPATATVSSGSVVNGGTPVVVNVP